MSGLVGGLVGGLVRATAGMALAIGVIAAAPADPPVRLLMTGQFHGDEVTARSGEVWLGLFQTASGYALRATTLTVTLVRDEILDDEDERTGKLVTVSDAREPLFLVKAAGRLRPRAVPTVFAGELILVKESHIRLAGPEGESMLTVDTDDPTEKSEALRPPDTLAQHSTLNLHTRGIIQPLFSLTEHDAASWEVLWAGDLDGDGKLDLLLDLAGHYNASELRLFLSTAAGKGEAVRQVAVLERVGC